MRLSKATIMPVQEIIFVSIFVQKDKKGTGVFTRDVQCVRNKDVNWKIVHVLVLLIVVPHISYTALTPIQTVVCSIGCSHFNLGTQN